jgi:hypothetical protein
MANRFDLCAQFGVDFTGVDKFARIGFGQALGNAGADRAETTLDFGITVPNSENGTHGLAFRIEIAALHRLAERRDHIGRQIHDKALGGSHAYLLSDRTI